MVEVLSYLVPFCGLLGISNFFASFLLGLVWLLRKWRKLKEEELMNVVRVSGIVPQCILNLLMFRFKISVLSSICDKPNNGVVELCVEIIHFVKFFSCW